MKSIEERTYNKFRKAGWSHDLAETAAIYCMLDAEFRGTSKWRLAEASSWLIFGFSWGLTPEGVDFWDKHYQILIEAGK